MQAISVIRIFKNVSTISIAVVSTLALGISAELNTKTFAAGQKSKIQGVIVSHEGSTLKLRINDDSSVATVSLMDDTKIQMTHRMFRKKEMNPESLVPGLEIKVRGTGKDNGDLVASNVTFDPRSRQVSEQIDGRVDPIEARTGGLETRATQLETRAGHIETREDQLDGRQKNTEQQVGEVKTEVSQVKTQADQANHGVANVNDRVTNLDNYTEKYSETIYFRVNSAMLTPGDKQKLDKLAQEAKNEKGYNLEVAGFTDITGAVAYNQQLSNRRAMAVMEYLQQQGDIPIHRILTPAGMGITHAAADNKTSAGRKLNRRVEVKVLVNQGIVVTPSQTAAIQ